jgi:protease I
MELEGKRVGILVADRFRDEEVFEPFDFLEGLGASVLLIGLERGTVTGKLGGRIEAEKAISEVSAGDFDALILPGGQAPERLRLDLRVLDLVRELDRGEGVLAAICHGPQILISAGLLKGRRATCFVGIRDDVRLAGARYSDEPVVVDGNLITSRKPEDIPAFNDAVRRALTAPVRAR